METIGARVKAARDHCGLRGIEVTRALGWKRPATIFDIEASKGGVSTKHLAALATLLNVSIDWLVTGRAEYAPTWARERDEAATATPSEPEAA